MPIIKSAKKKLRQDKRKEARNKKIKKLLKDAIKKAQNTKTIQDIKKAILQVNKAAQKKIIHKNKAAKLTSRLSKLISKEKLTKKKVEKK